MSLLDVDESNELSVGNLDRESYEDYDKVF